MSTLFEQVSRRFERGHMAEPSRLWNDPRIANIASFKPAAVLIAITERERPGMLLLHRPSTMRAHPGQIAFPGGRIDPGETPVEAALREANEELGIDPAKVRVVGSSDLYRTGSGYEITPVVGVVPPDLEITPNPAEVAQWFEAPVDFVLDPANQQARTLEFDERTHKFVEIVWSERGQDHRIWGVTGAILHNLSYRLNWND
ncbi:CoA pyrophosphatase [Novosphingobium pentaromativorans]|uniref:NUDIX hydrolase n=1 Tax=Novosphingobium pentaromativorans US6-1 TaxID=1088721 RepID=G6EID7_9SPHN|nr:CoA pyrophosphatase [Novosphingobium pentaromativorans]AIT78762.1 NUDIX hydrolase [Novosphingobium pentaromativorans US6-1]EHJ58879.1 NUDIX hydrolase [Novosphingobium pentaromativorans US6-1]